MGAATSLPPSQKTKRKEVGEIARAHDLGGGKRSAKLASPQIVKAKRMKPMTQRKMQVEEKKPLKWPEGWERTIIDRRKPQNQWKKTFDGYKSGLLKELEHIGARDVLITYNDPLLQRLDPAVAVYFSKDLTADFSWQTALELDTPVPTLEQIDAAYKRKAMEHHPDRGGDVEVFRQFTKHRDQARAWVMGTHDSEHEYVIACDKFTEARWNLAALRLALAAFRQLERVGIPSILERTFRGFRTALPQQGVK